MLVNIYKDAEGREFISHNIEKKAPLCELDVCRNIDWENAIVSANGLITDKNYFPKNDDEIICIRVMPSGAAASSGVERVKGAVETLGGMVVAPIFPMVGTALMADGITRIATGKAPNSQSSTDSSTETGNTTVEAGQTETIPSMRGARNSSGYGKAIPLILGKTLFTPQWHGRPYTTIGGDDGEVQYYNTMYILGYNDIDVSNIKLGRIQIASNSGHILNGFIPLNSGLSKYDDNITLEISTSSELSLYPQKTVQEDLSIELMNPEGTTALSVDRFSAPNPEKIELEFSLNALIAYDSSGKEKSATVEIGISISFDSGKSYIPFGQISGSNSYRKSGTLGISTITRKKNKNMRFVAKRNISLSEAKTCIEKGDGVAFIHVERINKQGTDSKIVDTVYMSAIRTWCFNRTATKDNGFKNLVIEPPVKESIRVKTTRLAMKIKATNELQGQLDSLNMILMSKCRLWSGSEWTDTKSASDNPAAVALMVMQSVMLKECAYKDSQIDLPAFGRLYEFCENQTYLEDSGAKTKMRFTCGGALTSRKKLGDVLDSIFSTCKAMRVLNGQKYSVLIDEPRTVPVTVLNNHNILKDSLENTKEFSVLPDGYKVSFVDEANEYDEGEFYCMYDGKSAYEVDTTTEDLSLPYVTNYKQAYKLARYELAKRKLRPEVWTRKVGLEGILIEVGSLVSIQDDTILVGIGDGGEILNLIMNDDASLIIGIRSDSYFNVSDLTKDYAVKINHFTLKTGHSFEVLKVSFEKAGHFNELIFESPIPVDNDFIPVVGDIFSFGIYGKESIDALCFGKRTQSDGTSVLTLIPYAEGIYTADDQKIPDFDSKITGIQPVAGVNELPADYVSRSQVAEVTSSVAAIMEGTSDAVDAPNDVSNLTVKANETGLVISWASLGRGLSNTIKYFEIKISSDKGESFQTFRVTSNMYQYLFSRITDGYPEVDDLKKYIVSVIAVNIYGKSSVNSISLNGEEFDLASYGTWIPSVPEFTKKEADEGGINFEWATPQGSNGRTLYGTNVYQAVVFYDNKERGVIKTENRNGIYNFNRLVDGYPEKPTVKGASVTLNKYTVQLTVINESGSAVQGTQKTIDFENYKTWIPYNLTGADYKPTSNASKRAATLLIPSQAQDVYGNVIFGVTISRRETDKDASNNLIFYTPDIEADCYSDIDSYKADSFDYVFFGGTFKQNLPLLGQDMLSIQVDRKDADFEWKKNTNQETGEIEFILEESEPYANTREYYTISDEGKNEFIRRYKNQIENFDSVLKQIESLEKDNYNNFVSVEWKLAESDFDSEHKNHIQRYATFRKISTPTPRDTEYVYRVIARNMFGNGQSEPYDINLTATANTVSDLVDKAITANKLDDQAVTTDKIAAGAITADEIAAVNILAKGASAGNMTAEGLQVPDSGFWAGKQMRYDYNGTDNLPHTYIAAPGEFFVGNNPNHIEDPSDADEYLHFLPARAGKAGQFFLAIKNVVMSSIATLIKGVFRVKNSLNDKDENAFFTVDPTPKTQGNPNGERVMVKGEVFAEDGYKVPLTESVENFDLKNVLAMSYTDKNKNTVEEVPIALVGESQQEKNSGAIVMGSTEKSTFINSGAASRSLATKLSAQDSNLVLMADKGIKMMSNVKQSSTGELSYTEATLLDNEGNINPDKVVKVWGAVWN